MSLFRNPECLAYAEQVSKETRLEASTSALQSKFPFEALIYGSSPSSMGPMARAQSAPGGSRKRSSHRSRNEAFAAGGALAVESPMVRSSSRIGLRESISGHPVRSSAPSEAESVTCTSRAASASSSRRRRGA
eukprot:gnl/TRDRNA2_/TRDRNA2_91157_c0_seq1.p2 gnl/TRDRNA2_/TRDRNA2_91157_c0~~gnl/TRDRNA2_/TRDRNA2_91157_c0_seq1.p2  ORF type:complete len:133 (-),score=15.76 gnl/TRDRNA2_/TRDRNA2_91157_c0_seq1:654-1052(-)